MTQPHPHDDHDDGHGIEPAVEELAETLSAGGGGRATGLAHALVEEGAFADALGGWRGMIDSSAPSLVFLVAYTVTGQALAASIWAAVVAGVAIAGWRLLRREPLQQVLGGLVGVAFCAWLAARTGKAEAFYLPGLLWNVVVSVGLYASALVRRPAAGYLVGAVTGDLAGWRDVPRLRRAYSQVTVLLATAFALRVVVQAPLYLAGWVEALGVARLAMGLPLYAAALFASYLIIKRARADGEAPPSPA